MRKIGRLLSLLLLALLVACNTTNSESPTPSPTAVGAPDTSATSTPIPTSEGVPPDAYPAPPTVPPSPEGYPPPATPEPLPDPYPAAGEVWLLLPIGEQCADDNNAVYADLQEAVTDLATAGVSVKASEMVDLPVCAACGCPTSTHYRVRIDATDLEMAKTLGWTAEQ